MKTLRVAAISLILVSLIAGCTKPIIKADNANYIFCTADNVCGFTEYGKNKELVKVDMNETPGCGKIYLSNTKRVIDLYIWECGGLICSSKDFKTVNCAAPLMAITIKK